LAPSLAGGEEKGKKRRRAILIEARCLVGALGKGEEREQWSCVRVSAAEKREGKDFPEAFFLVIGRGICFRSKMKRRKSSVLGWPREKRTRDSPLASANEALGRREKGGQPPCWCPRPASDSILEDRIGRGEKKRRGCHAKFQANSGKKGRGTTSMSAGVKLGEGGKEVTVLASSRSRCTLQEKKTGASTM